METGSKKRKSLIQLALLSAGHFFNDIHSAFLPTLLPEIIRKLSLSMTQAGFLNSATGLVQMLTIPFMGVLADRTNRPIFVIAGPILSSLGIALMPFAPGYASLLLCLAVFSFGSSTFHPQGQASSGAVAGESRHSLFVSLFSGAGMLGAAFSPLYAVFVVKTLGYRGLPVVLIPTFALAAIVYRFMPRIDFTPSRRSEGGFLTSIWQVGRVIWPVWAISLARDATFQGVRFFLPLFLTLRGGTLAQGGFAIFAITLLAVAASLAGGWSADRWGARNVIAVTLILSPLAILAATFAEGPFSLALFIAGTALLDASSPMTLAMGQKLTPHARGVASSILMGFSWGLAGIATYPAGMIADTLGLTVTLRGFALLPLISLPILFRRF
ncbi:MAG: MFS transporter [Synergistaceae bacterium]|nr:MFS transporter [Synergistaceae bacterium]